MIYAKQSVGKYVCVGAFVDDTDGKTPETALSIAYTDVLLSKDGGATAAKHETSAASHNGGGHYLITLDTTDTNTLGQLRIIINKSGALPVWMDVQVVAAATYDALVAGTGGIVADVKKWNGTDVATPNTAGVPVVDVTRWLGTTVGAATAGVPNVNVSRMNNVAATSITTINANIGQTQPVNFTGTGASAQVKSDTQAWKGTDVTTPVIAGVPYVDVERIRGAALDNNTLDLKIKSFEVINSAGAAITASGTTAGVSAIASAGDGIKSAGTTSGIFGTASAGDGIKATVTAGNGSGISALGYGSGHGFKTTGGNTSGDGIRAAGGSGTADGGHGINTVGGAGTTNGNGGHGLLSTGAGQAGSGVAGDGVKFVASSYGHGAEFVGGGSAGNAIKGTAYDNAMYLEANATGKHGLYARALANAGSGIRADGYGDGSGFVCFAVGGNASGMGCYGAGTQAGLYASSAGTGAGIEAKGGATSGDGIKAWAATSGHGIQAISNGASTHAIQASANSTNGTGINAVGTGTGHGMSLNKGGGVGSKDLDADEIAAIQTTTDKFVFTVANKVDATPYGGTIAAVSGAVGSVTNNVGGNVNGNVVGNVNGNLVGNVNGNVVGSVGSVIAAVTVAAGSISSIVAGVWDELLSVTRVASSFGAKLKNWVLGTDNKVLISADAQDLSATLSVNTKTITAGAINAAAIGTGAIDADALAADTITATKIQAGAITATKFAAGAIDATAIANGAIDAATFAAGAIDAAAIATGAVDADALATDAVTEIAGGILQNPANKLAVEATTGAVALSATSRAAVSDDIWDELLSGHAGAGSAGKALSDAAGNILTPADIAAIVDGVWDESAGAHVGAGTIGAQVKTVLDSVKTDTGTTIPAELDAIEGAGFATGTDSLVKLAHTGADGDTLESLSDQLDTDLSAIGVVSNQVDTVQDTLDSATYGLGVIKTAIDNIDSEVDDIHGHMPAGIVSDLTMASERDGMSLGYILELQAAMANGRFRLDTPSAGKVTFYKRDNVTKLTEINVTETERTRVS